VIVVFDVETDGLKAKGGYILEAAFQQIHAETLAVQYEATTLVTHDESIAFEPAVREMHQASGLLDELFSNPEARARACRGHRELDIWLATHFARLEAHPASILLCGMSIQFDRRWVEEHLPLSKAFLSHRMIDLSTIRELCRFWEPLGCPTLPKEDVAHRALDDCKMAVRALSWYRDNLFMMEPRLKLLDAL